MVVLVKCKKCGQEYPSNLIQAIDEQALKNNIFTNLSEPCPNCGQISSYDSPDFYWKL
jgi:rRNA maturation protein Nop10